MACDRRGIPIGWAIDGANRNDVRMLEPTLNAVAEQGLLVDVDVAPRPRLRLLGAFGNQLNATIQTPHGWLMHLVNVVFVIGFVPAAWFVLARPVIQRLPGRPEAALLVGGARVVGIVQLPLTVFSGNDIARIAAHGAGFSSLRHSLQSHARAVMCCWWPSSRDPCCSGGHGSHSRGR